MRKRKRNKPKMGKLARGARPSEIEKMGKVRNRRDAAYRRQVAKYGSPEAMSDAQRSVFAAVKQKRKQVKWIESGALERWIIITTDRMTVLRPHGQLSKSKRKSKYADTVPHFRGSPVAVLPNGKSDAERMAIGAIRLLSALKLSACGFRWVPKIGLCVSHRPPKGGFVCEDSRMAWQLARRAVEQIKVLAGESDVHEVERAAPRMRGEYDAPIPPRGSQQPPDSPQSFEKMVKIPLKRPE